MATTTGPRFYSGCGPGLTIFTGPRCPCHFSARQDPPSTVKNRRKLPAVYNQRLPPNLEDLKPWEWCENFLVPAAKSQELVDRWTDFHETKLKFPQVQGDIEFKARFDFGLLQTWTRL